MFFYLEIGNMIYRNIIFLKNKIFEKNDILNDIS